MAIIMPHEIMAVLASEIPSGMSVTMSQLQRLTSASTVMSGPTLSDPPLTLFHPTMMSVLNYNLLVKLPEIASTHVFACAGMLPLIHAGAIYRQRLTKLLCHCSDLVVLLA